MKDTDTIPIHEAKSNLSKLIKRAVAGETIFIGAYGKPEVALMAVNSGKAEAELRKGFIGCMKGKMELYEGWDDPLSDDEIESFYSMQGLEDFAVNPETKDQFAVADKTAAANGKSTAKSGHKPRPPFSKQKNLKKSQGHK